MPPISKMDVDRYHSIVNGRAERLRASGLRNVTTRVLEGYVIDAILDYANHHHIDLIVIGARGLSRAERLFIGSTSEGVLHHAKVPVLVVHHPTPQAEDRVVVAA